MTSAVVAVFARALEPGKVKTRLARTLGHQAALAIYTRTLASTMSAAAATGLPVSIWATDTACPHLQHLATQYGCSLRQQQGGTLGERMLHTLRVEQQAYERVVLVGSDCVVLDSHMLHRALEALVPGACVLAPAEDGGYVLIGSSGAVDWQLHDFEGVRWSSADTLADTLQCLQRKQVRVTILDTLWDIDTVDDVRRAVSSGQLDIALESVSRDGGGNGRI